MKKFQFFFLVKIVTVILFNYGFAAAGPVAAPVAQPAQGAAAVIITSNSPLGAAVTVPAATPALPATGSSAAAAATASPAPSQAGTPPAVTAPATTIDQALYKAMLPTTPIFNTAGESKFSNFTMFFSLINTRTPMEKLKTAVQELIKLVLTPVLEQTDIASQQVMDVVSMLNTIMAQLGTVELAAEKPLIAMLTPIKEKLATRSGAIADIDKKVTQAATIPDTQVSRKIEAYTTLLSKVGANMLDSTRQSLIRAITVLYAVAKNGSAAQLNAMKKMLPMIAANNSFKQDEKHLLTMLFTSGAVASDAVLTPAATMATGVSPVLAAAFKYIDVDANKQPVSVTNQCQIGHNSLPLITAVASIADKNLFIVLVNKLCTSYFTMNAIEIGDVESLCSDVLNNAIIVAPVDKPLREILQAWIQKLAFVKKVAEADKPLLTTIKNFSKVVPFDMSKCLQFLDIGINLLAGEGNIKLLPVELDIKNPLSLAVTVRDLMGKAYAHRSVNQPVLMAQLSQIFTSKNALALNYINTSWLDNIVFLNKILSTQALFSTHALQAIQDIILLVKSLVTIVPPATVLPVIDNFSKGVLENLLINFYASRATSAQVEIMALQDLYSECVLPAYKGIFSARMQTTFKSWIAGLALLNNLSTAEQAVKISTILPALEKVRITLIDSANTAMSDERARFLKDLQILFSHRGLWNVDELGQLSVFFKKVIADKRFCTLLGAGAVANITESIQRIEALHSYLSVGSSGAAALDRLLGQSKNIQSLTQALDLMIDEQTATKFRANALFKALKLCVSGVVPADQQALVALLQAAVAKKIGSVTLFTSTEMSILTADIATLQKTS